MNTTDTWQVTSTPAIPHKPGARLLAAGRIGPARVVERNGHPIPLRETRTDHLLPSGKGAHYGRVGKLRYPRPY